MMRPSRIALATALLAEAGLIAGLIAWCGLLPGVLLSLPLLLPLPGLLRGNSYTGAWASLLVVFYVAGLLSETYGMVSRHTIGGLLTAVAAVEFVALLMFVRWAARERRAVQAVR